MKKSNKIVKKTFRYNYYLNNTEKEIKSFTLNKDQLKEKLDSGDIKPLYTFEVTFNETEDNFNRPIFDAVLFENGQKLLEKIILMEIEPIENEPESLIYIP